MWKLRPPALSRLRLKSRSRRAGDRRRGSASWATPIRAANGRYCQRLSPATSKSRTMLMAPSTSPKPVSLATPVWRLMPKTPLLPDSPARSVTVDAAGEQSVVLPGLPSFATSPGNSGFRGGQAILVTDDAYWVGFGEGTSSPLMACLTCAQLLNSTERHGVLRR